MLSIALQQEYEHRDRENRCVLQAEAEARQGAMADWPNLHQMVKELQASLLASHNLFNELLATHKELQKDRVLSTEQLAAVVVMLEGVQEERARLFKQVGRSCRIGGTLDFRGTPVEHPNPGE